MKEPWQAEFPEGPSSPPDNSEPGDEGQSNYPVLDEVSYNIPLDEQAMQRLGRRVVDEIKRALMATQPRRENLKTWRAAYEIVRTNQSTRWLGAADVPSCLTRIYCQAASTRLNQQIVQAKPPLSVVARTQEAIDAAPYIEDAMAYVLDQAEWPKVADEVHTELTIAGNVFLRVSYEEIYRRVPVLQVEHDEEQTMAMMAAGAEPIDAHFEGLETTPQGKVKTYLGWEDRLKYRGVMFKVIPWQDGVVCPPTVRDARDAYGIGEILFLRGDELKMGARVGRYIEHQVEKLLQQPSDNPSVSDDGYNTRYERQLDQGILPSSESEFSGGWEGSEEDQLYREYLCYEMCWKGDWDGDGVLEWARLTVHYPSGTIIRLQYLPYEHGEPCYTMIPFLPRVNELYGAGMAEIISVYQDADTALMCQYIDHNDLALAMNGNYWYQKSAGLKPERQLITLGQPVAVDDVNGIKQMEFNPFPKESFELGQLIKDKLDLLTASSNPSLGQVTDASKTLGEVQIVAASANMMFEEMASRVARYWARIWDQVRWLVAQYGDGTEGGGITYRKSAIPGRKISVVNPVTGQPQEVPAAMVGGQEVPAESGMVFQPVDASVLRQDVDLVPTGLQLLSDMQSKLGQAVSVMQLLMNHPLAAGNMEVQKIALDVYLQAFHYPQQEKVMAAIEQGMVQMQVAQAQQQQMAMAAAQQPQSQGKNGKAPGGQPAAAPAMGGNGNAPV